MPWKALVLVCEFGNQFYPRNPSLIVRRECIVSSLGCAYVVGVVGVVIVNSLTQTDGVVIAVF